MLRRPVAQVCLAAGIASIFASVMILPVFTWFMVGMVMAPTYILLCLGSICLCANLGESRRRFALADWSVSAPPDSWHYLVGDELDYLIGEYRT